MPKHALLSASSSERWLNCTPSARLSEHYDDKGSDYAKEGTDAHTLCEYKLKKQLGIRANNPVENLTFFNEEMEDCADNYASFVLEIVETAKQSGIEPIVLIEKTLDFSKYAPSGFGTGDCLVVVGNTLHVIDYKHGQGVLVDATENTQLKLYALGALEIFDCIYDIETISMTIFQPRLNNISTFTIEKQDLYKWADVVLKPKARLAFDGKGELNCGDWCRFCKVKNECRTRHEYHLNIAKEDFALPPILSDDEIESVLDKLDSLISWANDLKDYVLQKALSGKEWVGFKLVEGRSNRKYISEDAVIKTVKTAGFNPYENKLLGVTAMEKLLGKTKFNELLSSLIEKPKGKPTLVPQSDKREPIDTAKNDFMED